MARTHLIPVALAAAFVAATASAQTAPGPQTAQGPGSLAPASQPAPVQRNTPKIRRPQPAAAAPAVPPPDAVLRAAVPPPRRPGIPAGAAALAAALAPDLRSSVGVQRAIFVQRFVAESLYRFDRENRRLITAEQLGQNIALMEKSVREGADRWWREADRARTGKIGRDEALAAAADQFRKQTGLPVDQTETLQQAGIRESFERGAAQQFARFDVDGDGLVVRSEVDARIAEEIERIGRSARIAKALVEDDTRGRKGYLDLEKATVALGGAFDELDANRDGTLGVEELPAAARAPDPRALAGAKPRSQPATGGGVAVAAGLPAAIPAAPGAAPETLRKPQKAKLAAPSAGPTISSDVRPEEAAAPPALPRAVKVRPQPSQKPIPPAAGQTGPDPSVFARPLPKVRGYGVTGTALPAEAR